MLFGWGGDLLVYLDQFLQTAVSVSTQPRALSPPLQLTFSSHQYRSTYWHSQIVSSAVVAVILVLSRALHDLENSTVCVPSLRLAELLWKDHNSEKKLHALGRITSRNLPTDQVYVLVVNPLPPMSHCDHHNIHA